MAEDVPRFCPFCRECFEAEVCPEHELPLVSFERLPAIARSVDPDERVALHELRLGRGWIFFGAMLLLVGFWLPFVRVPEGATASAFVMAISVAPNLFTVPAVSFALLSILTRRRTPRAMRGARLVVPALGLLVAISIAYTFHQVERGLMSRLAIEARAIPREGAGMFMLAVVVLIFGGAKFGVAPSAEGAMPNE